MYTCNIRITARKFSDNSYLSRCDCFKRDSKRYSTCIFYFLYCFVLFLNMEFQFTAVVFEVIDIAK